MIIRFFKLIHTLRIFFLVFIIVGFLFVAGLNPVDVTKFIGAKLSSAVGMSTSVPENPFNRLALELKEKEEALKKREQELKQREQDITSQNPGNYLVPVLAAGIIVLFALVLLNYYLDYKRREKEQNRN